MNVGDRLFSGYDRYGPANTLSPFSMSTILIIYNIINLNLFSYTDLFFPSRYGKNRRLTIEMIVSNG